MATFGFFGLIYLMGCFYSNSFNIKDWSEVSRGCIAFFGGALSIMFGGFLFSNLKK